jgi:hypothetical protein
VNSRTEREKEHRGKAPSAGGERKRVGMGGRAGGREVGGSGKLVPE